MHLERPKATASFRDKSLSAVACRRPVLVFRCVQASGRSRSGVKRLQEPLPCLSDNVHTVCGSLGIGEH